MMTTWGSPWNAKNKTKQNKKTTDRRHASDQSITCWLADDKSFAHSYVLTSFRYGCRVDCGLQLDDFSQISTSFQYGRRVDCWLMEHMMISIRNLQAFNMAAVLTHKKLKTKNKTKNPMISVSKPQAFDMAAVWTVDWWNRQWFRSEPCLKMKVTCIIW